MGLFKKQKRDEEFFYKYLIELSPGEMFAFQRALIRYMSEMTKLYSDVANLQASNNHNDNR